VEDTLQPLKHIQSSTNRPQLTQIPLPTANNQLWLLVLLICS